MSDLRGLADIDLLSDMLGISKAYLRWTSHMDIHFPEVKKVFYGSRLYDVSEVARYMQVKGIHR